MPLAQPARRFPTRFTVITLVIWRICRAWAGMPVQFDLQVRKFFCRNEACRQQIFCERLAEVALASARQTVRLNSYLQQCGWHLGGELSVRLTRLTGVRLAGLADKRVNAELGINTFELNRCAVVSLATFVNSF